MEHYNTFQWSIFTPDREQQYVVRCDDFEQFFAAIQQVLRIMPEMKQQVTVEPDTHPLMSRSQVFWPNAERQGNPQGTPAAQPEESGHFCPIHKDKQMKLRTSKDGQTWYDHRWKDESGQWHACNGERERVSGGS